MQNSLTRTFPTNQLLRFSLIVSSIRLILERIVAPDVELIGRLSSSRLFITKSGVVGDGEAAAPAPIRSPPPSFNAAMLLPIVVECVSEFVEFAVLETASFMFILFPDLCSKFLNTIEWTKWR